MYEIGQDILVIQYSQPPKPSHKCGQKTLTFLYNLQFLLQFVLLSITLIGFTGAIYNIYSYHFYVLYVNLYSVNSYILLSLYFKGWIKFILFTWRSKAPRARTSKLSRVNSTQLQGRGSQHLLKRWGLVNIQNLTKEVGNQCFNSIKTDSTASLIIVSCLA